MLTLLKQARAFGLGVVLATQNPVDLDYKGAVQRRHVVDRPAADRAGQAAPARRPGGGARGDRQGFDRARVDRLLSGLEKRVFLMHNVHEGEPLCSDRWSAVASCAGR